MDSVRLALIGGLTLSGCFSPPDGPPFQGGSETGGCPVGAETCACTEAGSCDPGLVCRSGLCVSEAGSSGPSGSSSDGGVTGSSSDGADGSSSDGADSSSSDGGDPCGGTCTEEQECVDGACVPACVDQEIVCDGECIDPSADANHCGAAEDCLGANAGTVCDPTPTSECPGARGEVCWDGACTSACPSSVETFMFSGELAELVLPDCVTEIHVVATGAQGGSSTNGSAGGLGARVEGDLCVSPGTTLTILVGGQAESAVYPCGGGGGSYVVDAMTPLFVAGGGGGGYYDWAPGGNATALSAGGAGVGGTSNNNGGGGGGFSTDGAGALGSGGTSFLGGGAGGVDFPLDDPDTGRGGFGGGGGSSESGTFNAGGGGGYDGGNAGNGNASTGGTSWIDPATANPIFTPATNVGHGMVEISW